MSLKLITPATVLAVSVADAKLHLRVDTSADDALIEVMIQAATELAEQITGRAITRQTWELTLDAFPATCFALTRVPVASVTSLKYVDYDGTLQTLDAAQYTLSTADDYAPARVLPAYGCSWPSARSQADAVALRYLAGYADAATVPESIKSWIKLQVGAMYENRESTTDKQTHSLGFADRLLDRYVVFGA